MSRQSEIENGRIRSTMLGYEDHGILTCFLNIEFDTGGQGFGGYAFDKPSYAYDGSFVTRRGTAYGTQFIIEILKVVGVEKWEDLKDKYIRVDHDYAKIYRIGNITKDIWFNPDTLLQEVKK